MTIKVLDNGLLSEVAMCRIGRFALDNDIPVFMKFGDFGFSYGRKYLCEMYSQSVEEGSFLPNPEIDIRCTIWVRCEDHRVMMRLII